MEIILDFCVDNYLWFLVISLILVFGLIGYIVDTREKKTPKLHFGDNEDINMSETIIDEEKSLKQLLEENNEEQKTENIIKSDLTINDAINNPVENNENELPKE